MRLSLRRRKQKEMADTKTKRTKKSRKSTPADTTSSTPRAKGSLSAKDRNTGPLNSVAEQQLRPGEWCYHENIRCAIVSWVLDDKGILQELIIAPERNQNTPKSVKVSAVTIDDRFKVNPDTEIREVEGK